MIEGIVILLIQIGIPLFLLFAGYIAHHAVMDHRQRYFRGREAELAAVRIDNLRKPVLPPGVRVRSILVTGSVVIGGDYFASFCGALRKFFGGEMKSFTRLSDDARRLALIRLREDALRQGGFYICNVRLATSMVQSQPQGRFRGMELIAYGTALVIES